MATVVASLVNGLSVIESGGLLLLYQHKFRAHFYQLVLVVGTISTCVGSWYYINLCW